MYNALENLGRGVEPLEPRVQFWKDPSRWPQDAGGFVFAARALLKVARGKAIEGWTEEAPLTEYVMPLPEALWLSTPVREIERGVKYLQSTDTIYRRRMGPGGLFANLDESAFPTTAEWQEAVAIAGQKREASWSKLLPFFRASILLEQACLSETIKSATRPHAGGPFSSHDWPFWNYENAWHRFDLCRVDIGEPERVVGLHDKVHWLYIEEATLQAYLDGPQGDNDVTKAKVPKEPSALRRRSGRRQIYDWRSMALRFRDMANAGQVEADMSTSAIADILLDQFSEAWEKLPDKRAVEEKVSEWRLVQFANSD